MGHTDLMALLANNGANKTHGLPIVPEHIPKVKDFYKEVDKAHPLPSMEFMQWRKVGNPNPNT